MLLRHLGRAGRTLPYDVRGRGRFASKLTSLLLKSGAEPIVHCDMAAGHRLRLDCRVPGHCWTFFSGKYDDEKRSAYCSRSCVLAGSHWMSEPIPDFTRFRWQSVQKKSDRAWSPWSPSRATHNGFVTNLALNGCADIAEVLEVALGNECGQVEIALADDFLAGGLVGKATFGSRELYTRFPRAMVQRETLDRIWDGRGRTDIVKLDIEGHETNFLEGGRETISAHRPVLLIELSRGHQEIIDFDTAISSLLPEAGFG